MGDIEGFIERWQASAAAERANYQLFLSELCSAIDLPIPEPTVSDERKNAYVFEKRVPLRHRDGTVTTGFIDMYRRGCFVLEAKQGKEVAEATPLFDGLPGAHGNHPQRGAKAWTNVMEAARNQAERYARNLPSEEGRPPFILVVDVGYSFEIYSEFSRSGGVYVPFPSPAKHRFSLKDLREERLRSLLRSIWLQPMSLDPSQRSARVTKEIAGHLAKVATSIEQRGHPPDSVASFLMRCLFTMFAEDTGLLPQGVFGDLLRSVREEVKHFPQLVSAMWAAMNTGGYSPVLREELLRFNGGLFADPTAIEVTLPELEMLIEAADANWQDVEPAIFGTLLERALTPEERHKLGAHYTPRAYVERLVVPTLMEPLRKAWEASQAAAAQRLMAGKKEEAAHELRRFHQRLCSVRVLDPACGSGNFLYVALDHLKRLEGEVLDALAGLMSDERAKLEIEGSSVNPGQFLGLETNPRAAKVAELVLWIGYLQWHFRTHSGVPPLEPIIEDFRNIRHADAVLAYEDVIEKRDQEGHVVTRWDGRTLRPDPTTGAMVPDESARVVEHEYINPYAPAWPDADFIIGNPPFLWYSRMRELYGNGYVDALQAAWPTIPEASDNALKWWHRAADLVREGRIERFGLICTNSISQLRNRRVTSPHLHSRSSPMSLVFAIPDHPWVDGSDSAQVRISMTVGVAGTVPGILVDIESESGAPEEPSENIDRVGKMQVSYGLINSDLTVGIDVTVAARLQSNERLCAVGIKTIGEGFLVSEEEAENLGLSRRPGLTQYVRPYLSASDLLGETRGLWVIDFSDLPEREVRERFPEAYQHLVTRIKPFRAQQNNRKFREQWWKLGHPRPIFRRFTAGLERFIVTAETSKHRIFTFLDSDVLPDSTLVTFGFDDAVTLGLLSSHVHQIWSLASGGRLGVGNDPRYNKTRCFETFPFPDLSDQDTHAVGEAAEAIYVHREERLEENPELTLTAMYNVLEKMRSGEKLSAKERQVHDDGLVSVLRELHRDLDASVAKAYGLGASDTAEVVLEAILELNLRRAEEESEGRIRFLRPDFQDPKARARQGSILRRPAVFGPDKAKRKWPGRVAEQVQAIKEELTKVGAPMSPEEIAAQFHRARRSKVEELVEILVSLGQVFPVGGGRVAA